ncbi:MAG: hypothetical protein GXY83_01535 [Rhodopirellula sp.]|nr:hypothetical protein [Rhodopirellula sp.]
MRYLLAKAVGPLLLALALSAANLVYGEAVGPARFTPLMAVESVQIVAHSPAYPGGRYEATNLVDGDVKTEYSSAGKGIDTFVDFDFGRPQRIGGMKHFDRNDPATVDQAEWTLSDSPDFTNVRGRFDIDHVASRGGTTTFLLDKPVMARYARWRVRQVGPKGHGTVGGAEMVFFASGEPETAPSRDKIEIQATPAVVREKGAELQPIRITIDHLYAEAVNAELTVAAGPPLPVQLAFDRQAVELALPPVDSETPLVASLRIGGKVVAETRTPRKPVRRWELVLLPHSHVDIGYTHVQTEVEQKQWSYLEQAIELAQHTAENSPEARFKWNSEVLWAVDSYLKQAAPAKRQALIDAVRKGWIGLDGLYGNELTALCRPEELFRLVDCARRLARQYDLRIDSAMISDVPGYTWGIVPALAHSGIKYFSIGPNHIHRIGRTLAEWGDRPFYWVSPSGDRRVLCWVAGHGYSWFHGGLLGKMGETDPSRLFEYLQQLSAADYPYDLVQLRYSIGGDNGPPDPELPGFVQQWNARYQWPKMRLATTAELMREFEGRYGERIPEVRGDFTPYWEDGAASSARETALARAAAERLVQAEILWTTLAPQDYPDGAFYSAWRNVILYNEHTWGAHCSISQPDSPFTRDQWAIKQAFAVDADKQSRQLVAQALAGRKADGADVRAVDVLNTCSWSRTDLVVLPAAMSAAGDIVRSAEGVQVPSQRLRSGELAFRADNVPPLGAKRYLLAAGNSPSRGDARADGATATNGRLRLALDPETGAIASLTEPSIPHDLVDCSAGLALNEYRYVAGRSAESPRPNGPAKITVEEAGPLVASLRVESEAPGCTLLVRRVRLVDGVDGVEIVNLLEKQDVREKESVHFGFSFHVPDGQMRLDIPWAVIRPEADQLRGACKNYFTVGRWADVSNAEFGVTWATIDAPLIEIGRITVDVASPFDPDGWIRRVDRSQTLYSYVMNNYWETNYKASQGGSATFRYAILPHGGFDQAAAARFGIQQSQPLLVVPVNPDAPAVRPLLTVEPSGVLVTSLKPSMDGKAIMLRLFNAGGAAEQVKLKWSEPVPARVARSSPREEAGTELSAPLELSSLEIVTLRAESRYTLSTDQR